ETGLDGLLHESPDHVVGHEQRSGAELLQVDAELLHRVLALDVTGRASEDIHGGHEVLLRSVECGDRRLRVLPTYVPGQAILKGLRSRTVQMTSPAPPSRTCLSKKPSFPCACRWARPLPAPLLGGEPLVHGHHHRV